MIPRGRLAAAPRARCPRAPTETTGNRIAPSRPPVDASVPSDSANWRGLRIIVFVASSTARRRSASRSACVRHPLSGPKPCGSKWRAKNPRVPDAHVDERRHSANLATLRGFHEQYAVVRDEPRPAGRQRVNEQRRFSRVLRAGDDTGDSIPLERGRVQKHAAGRTASSIANSRTTRSNATRPHGRRSSASTSTSRRSRRT